MMVVQTWNGVQKQTVREILFHDKMNYRETVWLTGYQMLDIDLAMRNGFIVPDAGITIVERNSINYMATKTAAAQRYPNAKVLFGKVEDQELRKIDFLNLDLCGMLSANLCGWLRRLKITSGGSIYINLCYAKRISDFMRRSNALVKSRYRTLLEDVVYKYNILDDNIAVQVVLLLSTLRNYNFILAKPIYYRDNVISMTTFRLTELRPCVPVYPDLLQELGVCYEQKDTRRIECDCPKSSCHSQGERGRGEG